MAELIKTDVLVKWFQLITEDDSTEVVCTVLEGINQLIKKIGPAFIQPSLEELCLILLKIFEKKIKCNNFDEIEDEEEQEQENEDADTRLSVFESASDLLSRLSKVLGAGFFPIFT